MLLIKVKEWPRRNYGLERLFFAINKNRLYIPIFILYKMLECVKELISHQSETLHAELCKSILLIHPPYPMENSK